MHTPGHAVMNVAALTSCLDHRLAAPIVAGAILPDVPIFILYTYGRLRLKLPESRIWSELYPQTSLLNVIHGMHSAPLALLGWVLGKWLGAPGLAAFFASMLLHSVADFPIHGKDAHRHFLPFSSYRFISPISYWDVEHHAKVVAAVELAVVTASAAVVGAWATALVWRTVLAAVVVWYGLHYRRVLRSHLPQTVEGSS